MKKSILLVLVLAFSLVTEQTNADFTFGERTNLGPRINSSVMDDSPSVSADGLELYFLSNRPGGYGHYDIWVTIRPTTDDPWGMPVNLGPVVNSSDWEVSPDISADGLSLYFDAWTVNRSDIWVAVRAAKDQPWGTPVKLGPNINRMTWQVCPSISPDGLQLYFESEGEIWFSTRQTQSEAWQPAINLGPPINTLYHDSGPDISIDGLAMFFHSNRPGGYGDQDLYVTTRPTIDSNWGNPINLGLKINTSYSESDACVSADGRMLYFSEWPNPRPGGIGGLDLWQAPILPIVDLNSDGIVNSADMCIMVDHWGENYSLCDIGPMPWGDGIVDVQDLIVLAEHLFEDYRLIAHWKLDETEGNIAQNSVTDNDGTLHGDPLWQPAGGKVGGALQFNGTGDYVKTPFVRDPSQGPFSVFAWIKEGAPGQVILSQETGTNWLLADTSQGFLMTELKSGGRSQATLRSQTVVTDGNWHRVGLTWDGSNRVLYVDDVEVARDKQADLAASAGGLYIGAGSKLAAETFFSGLIDDVRIYNKALNAEEIAALAQ